MIDPVIAFYGLIRHVAVRVTACACIDWIIGWTPCAVIRINRNGAAELCVSILPQVFAVTLDKSPEGLHESVSSTGSPKISRLPLSEFEIAVQALIYLVPQSDRVSIRFVFLLVLSVRY